MVISCCDRWGQSQSWTTGIPEENPHGEIFSVSCFKFISSWNFLLGLRFINNTPWTYKLKLQPIVK